MQQPVIPTLVRINPGVPTDQARRVRTPYGECGVHLRGLPTRAKIKELHRYWFDTGIPLAVDLVDLFASARFVFGEPR